MRFAPDALSSSSSSGTPSSHSRGAPRRRVSRSAMASATGSPRGFDSAAADEAYHAALRDEARRFRASDLGAAFPRRDVPGSPCEPGSAWSPSSGACVAVGGDIGAGAFGGFRVDDSALADPRLPTLVTLLLALAIAASLFLLVAFGVLALARLAANKLAKRRRFVSDALELVARALTGAVDVLARANDDPRDANDPGRGATDDDAPAESSPRAPRDPNRDDDPPLDDDPDPEPEPPAGSRLGAAMGAAIARLALRPEPVGPAEAREAAGDLADALVAYLEAGPDAADEFGAAFRDAAEKAFVRETTKNAAAARVGIKRRAAAAKGGERGPDPDSPSEKEKNPAAIEDAIGGFPGEPSSPSSSSASESPGGAAAARGAAGKASSKAEDAEDSRGTNDPGGRGVSGASGGSSASAWFAGFAAPWATTTTTGEDSAAASSPRNSGGSPRSPSRGTDPLASFASQFTGGGGVRFGDASGALTTGSSRRGFGPVGGLIVSASEADEKQLKVLDLAVRMREVLSSERANDIAEKRLDMSARALEAQRLNLDVLHESNALNRSANALAAEKLESDASDRRAARADAALASYRAALADSFYAGLAVVLCTTLAGGWRRFLAAFSAVVGVCPAPTHSTWASAAFDFVGLGSFSDQQRVGPLEYAWCVAKSVVGAAWGGATLLFVGWKLTQYNVVTQFQAAPATVLLLVLGVGCGVVGRNAVEALGGDGERWLALWRWYIFVAAFCAWRAEWIGRRLDRAGPVVRTAFHVALGGVLPFCVGAAPFEDVFAQVALEAGRRAQLAAGAVSDAAEIIGFGFFF